MSRSQIFRLEKAGQMPPRIFLSLNVSGWSEYEIELWLRSRVVYYRKKVRT
jgi:predicted DNA-binding transcriptional regulator AlpA